MKSEALEEYYEAREIWGDKDEYSEETLAKMYAVLPRKLLHAVEQGLPRDVEMEANTILSHVSYFIADAAKELVTSEEFLQSEK